MDMPKGKVAQAMILPLMIAITCGFYLFNNLGKPKKNQCAPNEEGPKFERNKLQSRVEVVVNPSNDPCEDRFNCFQLKNLDGFYSAVFDGHGGWQVAELA
mmetsp:Transcript_4584/g.6958  ORF Transcript_4584/g.6958 Transcript_4584/m.6958 type:complete len:100 (+) Transcript_4584:1050-1349(+)